MRGFTSRIAHGVWQDAFRLSLGTLVLFATCLLPIGGRLWCQSGDQGSISGIVFDPSGAVVYNAHLSIRNTNTEFVGSTTTNQNGLFRFPVLPVGLYELTADHASFTTINVRNIYLNIGAALTFTLNFRIADAKANVMVTAEAPLLEGGRSQVSTVIDGRLISGLPVNGRDFLAFVLLTPAVTRDVRGGLSFGGQRAMNSLLLDGINNDDPFWGQAAGGEGFGADGRQPYHVSQDAVREFQVNSNAYSAESGRAGGGVINTLTKSGTNDFHGSGFWFYRDKSLNANDPINKLYGLPKSPFHFNQFGGTLGGPIRKERLFFFVSYDGLRSSFPNGVVLNLPEAFQVSSDPTIAGFQRTALQYLQADAAPWVWPISQNDYLGKLDWQLARKHRMSVLWSVQRFAGGGFYFDPQNAFEHTISTPFGTDTGMVSLASTISNQTVNVARFGYLNEWGGFYAVGFNPEATIFEQGQRVLTIGRDPAAPQESPVRQFQLVDVLHHERGDHALKLGADVLFARIRFFFAQNYSGSYNFGSLESFGRSLSGNPQPFPGDSYVQSFSGVAEHGVETHPNYTSVAGFVEDSWRLRPNLTVNLGVRYDLQLIDKPPVTNPSESLLSAGLDTRMLPTDKNNFAPRVGVAWSPTNKVVARAGYGIFYAITPAALTSRAHFQNGITTQTRTFNGDSPFASLIPSYPNTFCGPPDPSGIPPNCAPPDAGAGLPSLQLFSANYQQPYVQQGSLGIEVVASRDISLSASYLMNKGTHLQQIRDVNLGSTVPETIAIANTDTLLSYRAYHGLRPISEFDRIYVFFSDANSIYHALAIQMNKRFAQNFQALASYTLSKVIDNNPNVYVLNPNPANGAFVQDPMDPRSDRGPGSNDQRHRFAIGTLWTLDYGGSLSSLPRRILHGWELGEIVTAQSGQPYSGLIGFDLNNDGNFATDRTPELGRNTFSTPATISLDVRLTRNIRLREHANLNLIVEGFNVLNHSNIIGVNNNQYSVSDCGPSACLVPLATFGAPTFSSGARIMQIAMKFGF